ncbi:MAG TPA: hypothetical protein ENJ26_00860 [Rhodobacteraceae bacterium]|nr:hypothetical protein [Paracoccaceae bacterium]
MSENLLEPSDLDLVRREVLEFSDHVDPTEDGIALAFAEKRRDNLRYDHTAGRWYTWDGTRWRVEETDLAFHYARELCREFNKEHRTATLPKLRTAAAVERFARADRRLAVTHKVWDRDPWLLATPGGTIYLRDGSMLENRRTDLITRATAVAPAAEMPTPLWSRFLCEATKGDPDLIRFLQVMSGYCLTGITREHALFFLYGLGGNGKGVFVNTIAQILGDYHVAANMDVFTASRYDRHPTELARLAGARLVTASETEEGRAWAESRIKQLTGGDPVAARYMRKDFFEYVPQFKLVFLGNHKPVLRNVDDAARRRFNIIPFTNKPETPDPELSEKLEPEYPGILFWMIEGCLAWQRKGLVRPEAVQRETESYFADQDVFTQWLTECTEKKYETTGETSAKLFSSWRIWAQRQGEDPGTAKSFVEKMTAAGFQYTKNTPGQHGKRGFRGISLVVADDDFRPYAD